MHTKIEDISYMLHAFVVVDIKLTLMVSAINIIIMYFITALAIGQWMCRGT